MCGIAGQADLGGGAADTVEVESMLALLAHRGPDGGGLSVMAQGAHGAEVVLGHRRLAVIDPSAAGAQPLTNEDGSVAVVFNGEIYNFAELRRRLEGRGHTFRSQTDTEVIVHGYEEFGDAVVRHLDGMFAFALWDGRQRRLLLARDRVGKKPLYYACSGSRIAFASEIKALRACEWIDTTIAWDRVPELLAFGYVPWPLTLYTGVRQLPPASTMIVDGRGVSGPEQFWLSPFATPPSRRRVDWTDSARQVHDLLRAAVERRLVSDVPLGVLLSGGLDSAAVVAMMSELGVPIRTFTVAVADHDAYDERHWARLVAERFGTEHTEVVVRADASQLVEQVLWHLDEPMADSSCIPTFLVAQEARRHVTVVLTGDGGDEIFAGYDRFRAFLLARRLPPAIGQALKAVTHSLPGAGNTRGAWARLARFAVDAGDEPADRYGDWVALFGRKELEGLLGGSGARTAYRSFHRAMSEADGAGDLNALLHANLRTYLHDDLLVKVDRMTMAHSLEARSPFLDVTLMEAVAALPASMKATPRGSKRILRRALKGVVPDEVLRRPKQGFAVPVGSWFRGPLRQSFEDLVLAGDARTGVVVQPGAVAAMHRAHQAGVADHGAHLWSLLAVETWLRAQEVPAVQRRPAAG